MKDFLFLLLITLSFLIAFFRAQTPSSNTWSSYQASLKDLRVFIVSDPQASWRGYEVEVKPLGSNWPSGNVLIFWPLFPRPEYGQVWQLNCSLELPSVFPDFDYRSYLDLLGIKAICFYPHSFKYLGRGEGNNFLSFIYSFKGKWLKLIQERLVEPESGLAAALFLGYRDLLYEDKVDDFRLSGLSHLVAISGTHISFLLLAFLSFFIFLGGNRRYFLPFAFVLSSLYVVMIGASVSARRALIMGLLSLYAWQRGKLSSSWRSLLLVAAIMLCFEPKLLIYSLGFQLSFSALAGIVFLYPRLSSHFNKLNISSFFRSLLSAFLVSLSAQLAIWPILSRNFGIISLFSPLANLGAFLVFAPLLSSLLIASCLSFLGLGGHLIWLPSHLLLSYLLSLAKFFSHLPGAYIAAANISPVYIWAYYILLIFYYFWPKIKKKRFAR